MQEEIAKSALAVAKFLVYYIIWPLVLFNLGRVALLLITFGRYPRGLDTECHVNQISLAGVFVLVLAWSLIAVYNNTVGAHA
ncbi:hypothetical protein [Dokdonella soli]|uniref:Uncharacterized protein n=1 Tax=Dokdonella soli TaxID=529810 RepID=A0ABP3TN32_9GAMM